MIIISIIMVIYSFTQWCLCFTWLAMFMLAVVSNINVSKLAYRIQRFNWTEKA